MRYVFHHSLTWSEELSRYCQIWLFYLAAVVSTRKGKHIRVDLLDILFPKSTPYTNFLSNIMSMFFNLIIFFLSAAEVKRYYVMGKITPALEIYVAIVALAIPMGSILMALRFAQKSIESWRNLQPK